MPLEKSMAATKVSSPAHKHVHADRLRHPYACTTDNKCMIYTTWM